MKDEERLAQLYKQAAGLNEELPGELIKKMKVYTEILAITGKLHAVALRDWKLNEALRKEAIAKCYSFDPEGTVKDREYKAEFAASEHRKNEAVSEAECMRWRNAYTSMIESINVLKIQLRDMKDLENGKV